MSFIPVLKESVERVKGAVSAMVLGMDGMPIEEFTPEGPIKLEELTAESAQIFKDISRASKTLELGSTEEVTLVHNALITPEWILRFSYDDYLLLESLVEPVEIIAPPRPIKGNPSPLTCLLQVVCR